MIAKPQTDWSREDRTVQTARQFGGAASKALSAGASGVARVRALYRSVALAMTAFMLGLPALAEGRGRNIPMCVGVGCASLLLGWLALRNARLAFGRSQSAPAWSDPQPANAGLGNWQDPFSPKAQVARETEPRMQGGEFRICYSRGKIYVMAAKLFAVGLFLALALTFDLHMSLFIRTLILFCIGFVLWRLTALLVRAADKDLTAISWNGQQICVRTLTASRQVPWQAVESVKTVRRVVRVMGIIPVSTSHELLFRLRHNSSRRLMRVPASALDIRPDLAEALMRVAALSRQT
jgi:hypothetical protein